MRFAIEIKAAAASCIQQGCSVFVRCIGQVKIAPPAKAGASAATASSSEQPVGTVCHHLLPYNVFAVFAFTPHSTFFRRFECFRIKLVGQQVCIQGLSSVTAGH